jgi:hypothetical protein
LGRRRDRYNGGMNNSPPEPGLALPLIGAAVFCYLALLARSAWKQGEIRQFAVSLGVVVGLLGALAAIVALYIAWQGG